MESLLIIALQQERAGLAALRLERIVADINVWRCANVANEGMRPIGQGRSSYKE